MKDHEASLSFKQVVDVQELSTLKNNDIRHIDDVEVVGICTVDKSEIIFSYTVSGEMTLPCARTLVDVLYPFRYEATEIFTTVAAKADEEEEIHFIQDDIIDLKPYILETILLQMPYRVFSNEKMIESGDGWSFYSEDSLADEKAKK